MAIQPYDSSQLSLDEFCSYSRSVKFSEERSGKFRDVIDAFRTVYWFHSLRIGLDARTTYQMERKLEPDAFGIGVEGGGNYRRNKWGGYRRGKHTPSKKLIANIEERFEGVQNEFEHVLWDALRLSNPMAQNANSCIRRLDPEVQAVLWSKKTDVTGNRTRIRQIKDTHLQMIERRASLDSLACLTILLREAAENGWHQMSFKIAKSACRVLLMIGEIFNGHGIVRPLYEYYEGIILPLACWEGKRHSFRGMGFMELVGLLSHRLYHLNGVDVYRLSMQEKIYYKVQIINGNYGWDYLLLLNPIEVPTTVVDSESAKYHAWSRMEKLRQWALNNIRTGGDGLAVPVGIIFSD